MCSGHGLIAKWILLLKRIYGTPTRNCSRTRGTVHETLPDGDRRADGASRVLQILPVRRNTVLIRPESVGHGSRVRLDAVRGVKSGDFFPHLTLVRPIVPLLPDRLADRGFKYTTQLGGSRRFVGHGNIRQAVFDSAVGVREQWKDGEGFIANSVANAELR